MSFILPNFLEDKLTCWRSPAKIMSRVKGTKRSFRFIDDEAVEEKGTDRIPPGVSGYQEPDDDIIVPDTPEATQPRDDDPIEDDWQCAQHNRCSDCGHILTETEYIICDNCNLDAMAIQAGYAPKAKRPGKAEAPEVVDLTCDSDGELMERPLLPPKKKTKVDQGDTSGVNRSTRLGILERVDIDPSQPPLAWQQFEEKLEPPARRHREDQIQPGEPDANGRPVRSKFRFRGTNAFLTYSRAKGITFSDIRSALEDNGIWQHVKQYTMAQEPHADGEHHYHVLLTFTHRLSVTGSHMFDVYECHPNIQSAKSTKAVRAYLYKGYNGQPPIIDTNVATFDWSRPNNFIRRFQDDRAYGHALSTAKLPHADIMKLPWYKDNKTFKDILQEAKTPPRVRSLYFVGPANTGKTTWIKTWLADKRVFMRAHGDHNYEGYNGEHLIFCDDVQHELTYEEICSVLNPHLNDHEVVWTKTKHRYNNVYYPKNVPLSMIVLHTKVPSYANEDWFKTRFYLHELQHNEKCY